MSDSYCWQLTLPSESAKIAFAILPLGTQPHFPAVLISITVFAQKKKSGSYCWQLSLPSESAKIASAILPYGTQPYFPTVLISITVFAQKKSLAATYFPTARAVSSALESLTSVFGMGTGIASPLWPPDILQNSRFELLTPTMST